MSDQLTLPADLREGLGKGASRALRNEGRVPAVIYGDKKDPVSVHVEDQDDRRATLPVDLLIDELSAEKALDLIVQRGVPHLAVVDIYMPGMGGPDFCSKLQEFSAIDYS